MGIFKYRFVGIRLGLNYLAIKGIIKFVNLRKDARVVEWDGLENRLPARSVRGFESLSFRKTKSNGASAIRVNLIRGASR
jgi:hypothetical protein